ncbi:MAG: PKD domain-containing protein, partial [Cellulomonadaceae bacterium]|nr:PKD domain-containing protein [Cellulomonadaceae bacterium]
HFGAGGNLEGTFRADPTTGALLWVADCHGDTYSAFPQGDVVYSVGHAHYCGNLPGGFPQTTPWTYHHISAFTLEAQSTSTPDIYGYQDHAGQPAPGWLHIWPQFVVGSFTGQGQAGWSVSGNADYVVMGGEFPSVNGTAQQGLVRFARSANAPDTQGPRLSGSAWAPRVTSTASGTVQVQWQPNWDRDNETLTYRVYRGSQAVAPVHQRTVTERTWVKASMGFTDTGLAPGSTQQYRITATDPFGNVAQTAWVPVTVASSGTPSAYVAAVRADEPVSLWRLDETSGTTVADLVGTDPGAAGTGVTRGAAGAVGDGDTASTFSGTSAGLVHSTVPANAPDAVSVEAWVRTTTTRGGKVVGYGSAPTGTSNGADRHLYLDNTGRVFFGMHSSGLTTINSTGTYRDGQWHHLVGTYGSGVMNLYVDGQRVAQRTGVTYERSYWGFWRIGGDRLASWPSRPSSDWLAGSIDDVAVYWKVLSADRVLAHYVASGRGGPVPNTAPTAAFTATSAALTASVNGAGSTDPDGTVVGYAWTFGDGGTGTGSTASHTYAADGTYTVRLTVTDDDGATGTVAHDVTVAATTSTDLARDAFERSLDSGWGQADVGGPWALTGSAAGYAVVGGQGLQRIAAAGSTRAAYLGVASTSTAVSTSVGVDKPQTGSGTYISVVGRRVGTAEYAARLKVLATGVVNLAVTRSGTALQSTDLPGTYVPGTRLEVRLEVTGTDPTTLRAKVWPAGGTEPAAWQVSASDATAGLQAAGGVGVVSYLSGASTNAPMTVSVDDLVAVPLP